MNELSIEPMSRRSFRFFSAIGLIGIIISIGLQQYNIKLPAYILLLISLMFFILGVSKYLEPKYSLTVNEKNVIWHLRNGNILIDWKNIVSLTRLHVNKGQGQQELHYLGLKLWDLSTLIHTIPPRLAKQLFHDYRSLLHVALVEAQFRNDDVQNLQEDSELWISPSGEKFTGIKGMFAARLAQLKHYLGADLYLPTTILDRSPENFIALFKQLQVNVNQIEYDQSETDKNP